MRVGITGQGMHWYMHCLKLGSFVVYERKSTSIQGMAPSCRVAASYRDRVFTVCVRGQEVMHT